MRAHFPCAVASGRGAGVAPALSGQGRGGDDDCVRGAWTFEFDRGDGGNQFKTDETFNAEALRRREERREDVEGSGARLAPGSAAEVAEI